MSTSMETVAGADDWLDQPLHGAKAIGECRYVQVARQQTAAALRCLPSHCHEETEAA
jgi:hypothetical protein